MTYVTNDRVKVLSLWAMLTIFMMAASCAGGLSTGGIDDRALSKALPSGPAENMPSSLHATAAGMQWWYERPNGPGDLTKTPFASTGCGNCHTKGCSDCHGDVEGTGKVDQPAVCLGCHGRQRTEVKLGVTDIHFLNGMQCSDCHLSGDIHGDGTAYNSLLEDGAIDADCLNCHRAVSQIQEHTVHGNKLHCDACHIHTVTTCYNCHFNSLLQDHKKKAYRPFKGFVMLVNDANGKVRTGTYHSLVKDTHTFVAFGPFHGHSVTSEGRTCTDCHNNERVRELGETGKIVVTRWDDTLDTPGIIHTTGVLPFVPDALEFQFVDYDKASDTWLPLATETGQSQWEFCSPLTTEQLEALATTRNRANLPAR